MISICLKSNNLHSLNLIEESLDNETFPEIYYTQREFKHFKNLIIHYKGKKTDDFNYVLSKILTNFFISTYEKNFLKQQLNFDFFYFSDGEKNNIFEKAISVLDTASNFKHKFKIIKNSILDYFSENSFCNLEGFANFRLYEYKKFMNNVLENAINDYVLQKEYFEYINLLHEYINLQLPQTELVHLLYGLNHKLLLDKNR